MNDLKKLIREVPDYPKPGILFYDLTTLLKDKKGFHSLIDASSNVVGLIGIRAASQPPDEDHPYGHRKYETVASSVFVGFAALVVLGRTVVHVVGASARRTRYSR